MAEVATKITDFTSTGRTGRRNALPDILDVGTTASGDDLVVRLDSLALGKYLFDWKLSALAVHVFILILF